MATQAHVFQPGSEDTFLLYAEGLFSQRSAKTAHMLLRYTPDRVACVVDSTNAGQQVRDVYPNAPVDIPIVESVEQAIEINPTHFIIGVAPVGGQLPSQWRASVLKAIESKLTIVSGLHTFLSDDPEIQQAAESNNVAILDLRQPPEISKISTGSWRNRKVPVVLTIAPDSAIGKLTAAWELKQQLEKRGKEVGFVATGQTGILLHGEGIVVDALRGDFISSAVESMIETEIEKGAEVVIVEGQGAIFHEGFSAVTLGILHGCMPDAFLFVHRPGRNQNDYGFHFPPYRKMINVYEELIEWFRPAVTIGVQLDTSEYEADTARKMVEEVAHISGLSATDFVRFPDDPVIDEMIHKLHLDS